MAGTLIPAPPGGHSRAVAVLTLLTLAVLLFHAVAMVWLATGLQTPSRLQVRAEPLLTRTLQPLAPAPPPLAAAPKRPRTPITPSQAAPASPSVAPQATPQAVTLAVADSLPLATVSASPVDASPSASPSLLASSPVAQSVSAIATTPTLSDWPSDTRLKYRLGGNYRGALHGSAEVLWQRQAPDAYQVRIDVGIGWLANLSMTSQGRITPDGLQPEVYEEQVQKQRRGLLLQEQSIRLNDGQREARPPQVQDTASQFVELSQRFRSGRSVLAVGEQVRFWLARPNGLNEWTYDVVDAGPLQTGLGTVQAFHLKPRPLARPRGSITAEMWFAPSLQYLPVRIRMNVNEDTWLDLLVEKIEQQ